MLFIAERVAELAAISSREFRLLSAIAPALDSARTVANVIVETLIVNFSSRGFKSHSDAYRFSEHHRVALGHLTVGRNRCHSASTIGRVRNKHCYSAIARSLPRGLSFARGGVRRQ